MPHRSGGMVLLFLAACLLGSLPSVVDAHAALLTPTSRNEVFFNGAWVSTAGNGLGDTNNPIGFPGKQTDESNLESLSCFNPYDVSLLIRLMSITRIWADRC